MALAWQTVGFGRRLLVALAVSKSWYRQKDWNVVKFFQRAIERTPDKEMLVFVDENRSMTYREFDELSRHFAKWALEVAGVRPGSSVSLVKQNSPEFVVVWFALARIGVKTALLNHNLTGFPLANCLKLAAAESTPVDGEKRNLIIYGQASAEKLFNEEVLSTIAEDGQKFEFWCYNGGAECESPGDLGFGHTWQSLDESLVNFNEILTLEEGKEMRKDFKSTSTFLYIYTSGTTGLPKAAKISSVRFCFAGVGFAAAFKLRGSDRIYCPLPIYHSAGGMLGLSCAIHTGATFCIRTKFSASNFFKDCKEFNCTIVQYIGEVLRYLNSSPETAYDRDHPVRMAMGNGLRKSVWLEFQERFGVKHIAEFYGATEGNATMVNATEKPGACGFMPKVVRLVYPVKIIAVDPEDEETPLRNKKGLCRETRSGEVGICVGKIKKGDPTRAYDGYTNEKASNKKILTDVLVKGDKYFNSGDLVRRDGPFVYFVDRIGDTFRWKGENCSTREVEEQIEVTRSMEQFEEVNVYGVKVEGSAGRACMAYIRLKEGVSVGEVDLDKFYQETEDKLTDYQLPLFVRFRQGEFENTSTFKHKKVQLRKEGFDPSVVSEQLFFRHPNMKRYVTIDEDLYNDIQASKFRL